MLTFAVGVIIGIYLGTYYDFRPVLETLMKWGTEQLPPPRTAACGSSEPATKSIFSALLTSSEKD